MQAIAVRDRDAGPAGLSLTELPYPQAAENDVIVRAWQALFEHAHLRAGQTVLINGAAGASARSLCSLPTRSAPG